MKREVRAGNKITKKHWLLDSDIFNDDAINTLVPRSYLSHNGLILDHNVLSTGWYYKFWYLGTKYTGRLGYYPELSVEQARYKLDTIKQEVYLNLY